MDDRKRALKWISLILEMGVTVAILSFKIVYYWKKNQNGFFSGKADFVAWVAVSIFISVYPIVSLLIPNIVALSDPGKYERYAFFAAFYLQGLIFNIVLESISFIGGTMCLDGDWINIVIRMFTCHIVSIIPFIMLCISEGRPVRKNEKYT